MRCSIYFLMAEKTIFQLNRRFARIYRIYFCFHSEDADVNFYESVLEQLDPLDESREEGLLLHVGVVWLVGKYLKACLYLLLSELPVLDLKLFNVIRTLPDMTDDQLDALANFTRAYTIENHIKEKKGPDHRVLGMGKQ